MKLIKSKRVWIRWAKEYGVYDSPMPDKYPCYAYTHCTSFGYEESEALYLYHEDLMRMATETAETVTP